VTEETTNRQASLEVLQQGATGGFQVPAGCSVSSLPYASTVNGSIGGGDCAVGSARTRYYTFQGLTDQQISINMRAGRFVSGGLQVPLFRLYGPGGGQILSAGGNVVVDDPHVSARNLFCSGTYTVQVTSRVDSTFNPSGLGNYTLRLDSN